MTTSPSLDTQLVRGGLERTHFDETAEALFLTSGFVYGSASEAESAFAGDIDRFIYGRYGNPTVAMFEERLRLVEGAEACVATSSGMAAIYAALAAQLRAGDRLVASRALFGSCSVIVSEILPRMGVEVTIVDGRDLDAWEAALSSGADVVFVESPSNPGLEVIDLAAVAELAHAAGATVVVDNVFASPILQRPLELGADVVVYSATKHIDGQGRVLGGAVLGSAEFVSDTLVPFTRHTGPSMSPFNAWVLLKGLETLRLRVDAQCASAHAIARWLEQHGQVSRVLYPALPSHPQHELAMSQMSAGGSVIAVHLHGDKGDAFEMLDALQLFDISNNLGDAKSLVTHPATTTHRRLTHQQRDTLSIGDSMIRLSVGLEATNDLINDLDQALTHA